MKVNVCAFLKHFMVLLVAPYDRITTEGSKATNITLCPCGVG